MKTKGATKKNVNVITLGCSKNVVDSENLIAQLKANDFDVIHDSNDTTEIVIVNTCGFIDLAKQESVETILSCAESKKRGEIDILYVTGCLSERYKSDLEKEIPEVDAYFGTMELPGLLHRLNADYKHELIGERSPTTPQHYAYLKISEGCNRTCSFCAIPLMRGHHVSRSIEDLEKESRHLARIGVKEIILIAQELTYYGLDIYKKRALPELLDRLCEVAGISWIRLHYAYPSKFPREIFEVMVRQPKICNYLDIPLQHADDGVLERMKRQITQSDQRDLIAYARKNVPGIAIRTTILVGFPGESEEEFVSLLSFIRDMRFERLGVFEYSHEEDTTAYLLDDNLSSDIKLERKRQIMEVQEDISNELNQNRIGQVCKVIVDRKEGDYFIGRTEYDSPEVDNEVLIDGSQHYARIGDFITVKITEATAFDLIGIPEDERL